MPKNKMKTNKAAAKRFDVTGSGKVRHKKKGLRHNLEHLRKSRKNRLGKAGYLKGGDAENTRHLIPYK